MTLGIFGDDAGNREAGRLAEHAPFVRREARRLSPCARIGVDGSDLAQEAWVAALEAERRGKGPRPDPRAEAVWLRRILRNKAAEAVRRARTAKRGGEAAILPLEDEVAGHVTTPSEKLRRAEREQCLARALQTLNARDRQVLNLTLVQDRPRQEVAALLGIGDGYARRLRRDALERLRAAYEALGGPGDLS